MDNKFSEYVPKELDNIMQQYAKEQLLGVYVEDGNIHVNDPETGKVLYKKEGYNNLFFFPALNRYLLLNDSSNIKLGRVEDPKSLSSPKDLIDTSLSSKSSQKYSSRNYLYISWYDNGFYLRIDPITKQSVRVDIGNKAQIRGVSYIGDYVFISNVSDPTLFIGQKAENFGYIYKNGAKLDYKFYEPDILYDIVGYNNNVRYIAGDPLTSSIGTSYGNDITLNVQKGGFVMCPIKFINWNTVISIEVSKRKLISIYKCDLELEPKVSYHHLMTIPYPIFFELSSVYVELTDNAVVLHLKPIDQCFVYWFHGGARLINIVSKEYKYITIL